MKLNVIIILRFMSEEKNLNKFESGNLHQIFTFSIINIAVAMILLVGGQAGAI